MKTWLIPLSLLCAAGIAMAEDKAQAPAVPQPQAAAIAQKPAPAKHKRHKPKSTRLPRGDLRQCLEEKGNMAIIACSEQRQKR
jgi:hypothetical protein